MKWLVHTLRETTDAPYIGLTLELDTDDETAIAAVEASAKANGIVMERIEKDDDDELGPDDIHRGYRESHGK